MESLGLILQPPTASKTLTARHLTRRGFCARMTMANNGALYIITRADHISPSPPPTGGLRPFCFLHFSFSFLNFTFLTTIIFFLPRLK